VISRSVVLKNHSGDCPSLIENSNLRDADVRLGSIRTSQLHTQALLSY
jgi:hypothetical protein